MNFVLLLALLGQVQTPVTQSLKLDGHLIVPNGQLPQKQLPFVQIHGRGLALPPNLAQLVQTANLRGVRLREKLKVGVSLPAKYLVPYRVPVKNQGQNGDCWGFSSIHGVECKFKEKGKDVRLSEQYIINHNTDGSTCHGGYLAFEFLRTVGTTDEATVPFVGCRQSDNAKPNYKIDSWAFIRDDWSIPTDVEIKTALITHGPIVTTVAADESWDYYLPSTLLKNSGPVNHMITIVGYDDSLNCWIIDNSWGTDWGMNGSAYVKYGSCNIGAGSAFCAISTPDPPQPQPNPPQPNPDPNPKWVIYDVNPIYLDFPNGYTYGLIINKDGNIYRWQFPTKK